MCTCEIRSHIEGMKSRYAQTVIVGWAVSLKKREIQARVTCGNQPVQGLQVEWTERPDIFSAFFAREMSRAEVLGRTSGECCVHPAEERISPARCVQEQALFGFRISFPSSPEEIYRLAFSVKGDRGQRQVYTIQGDRAEPAGMEGVKKRLKKSVKKLLGRGESGQADQKDREAGSRKEQERRESAGEQDPLISIIVPVYRPEPVHFMEMIRSVTEQTYGKWQLCLADGSEDDGSPEDIGDSKPADLKAVVCFENADGPADSGGFDGPDSIRKNAVCLGDLVREASGGDERVEYRKLERNLGISGNTNQALAMAKGQWIAMVDHDDLLEPEALAEAVRLLRKKPEAGFIYTDSDLTDQDGIKFYNALLKPDWSPETLYSANYITHFSLIRKDMIEAAGGFDSRMDGAQDWDIFFKAAERAEMICHIPRVLYHWRVARTSTARSVETKPYALDAQLRAINAHLKRMGYEARAFFQDRERYLIRVEWNRKVKWKLLRFEEGSGVGQVEQTQTRIWEEGQAEKQEGGQALVYLIDFGTVEPVTEETCRELAQWAVAAGIGLVFPKLLDKDGRIVSAGITVSKGHGTVLYAGSEDHMADQMGNTDWYRNVKAQFPSLFAISAENWEKYGGMEPADSETAMTEYALRLSAAGLRHLMNPFARAVLKS